MKVSRHFLLASHEGAYLSVPRGTSKIGMMPSGASDMNTIWGVSDLGNDHWALRAPNGLYLSAHTEGRVSADALFLGEREILSVEHRPAGIALRTSRGAYLALDADRDVKIGQSGVAATFLLIDPFHHSE
jgi:hypothetical protein